MQLASGPHTVDSKGHRRSRNHDLRETAHRRSAAGIGCPGNPARRRSQHPLLGKKKKVEDTCPARKLTASQNALIDKAIVREKEVVKTVRERAPLVETYIQNMRPDPLLSQVPESDQHFLGRVEFCKVIGDNAYKVNEDTAHGHQQAAASSASSSTPPRTSPASAAACT